MRALAILAAVGAALLAMPLTGSAQPSVSAQYTRIANVDGDTRGKCLGISGSGLGGKVEMVPCAGKAWEYWYIDGLASGDVRFRTSYAKIWNTCMHASGGRGNQLTMATCNGSVNQAFTRRYWDRERTLYTLESVRYSGQCVDVKDWGRSTVVQLWDCHDGDNQLWYSRG